MERRWVFVLLDVLCVLVASLPFTILTFVNAPYKRGFYCGDDSIRYPYRPDTITHGLMAGVIITATVILVSAGEAYLVYTDRLYSRSDFNNYLAALYKVLGTFLFGAAVSQSLTDLAKYMTGRLRPNFLAVCDPDWSRVNCSVYVQVDVCREALLMSPSPGCLSTLDIPPLGCTAWCSWRSTCRPGSAGSGHGC